MNMNPKTATVVRVPPGTNIPPLTLAVLSQNFRKARLAALQADPSAFSSSYERESQFDDAAWARRLQNPLAQTFVALAKNRTSPTEGCEDDHIDDDLKLLSDHPWVGMVVLLGPRALAADGSESASPWKVFSSMGPSSTLDMSSLVSGEAAYFAASMFVLPEARKQGIGRRLVVKSVETVGKDAMNFGARKVNISLLVSANNAPAISLYQSCGFEALEGAPEIEELQEKDLVTVAMAKTTELVTI
ncbi:hypothetical protein D8B26_006676 [Coccidioides posadasii str. Silveira]|uniref:Uncharacterized protein n=2 Tax=Coccidioides posadasii TaxID=199306 RepID=E9CUN4_COCPS|nr:conserved hypothetical protein [Coccidioides posadasii str. Silveira]QVM12040.1 hypothetical protein D8B26_006676 [Coccidioides posadasii str. Silveira]